MDVGQGELVGHGLDVGVGDAVGIGDEVGCSSKRTIELLVVIGYFVRLALRLAK